MVCRIPLDDHNDRNEGKMKWRYFEACRNALKMICNGFLQNWCKSCF